MLRFVVFMCLYARDVEAGELPGPYAHADAELFARCTLIDDAEFRSAAEESDETLAGRFGVPVEQVARKREDLRLTKGR